MTDLQSVKAAQPDWFSRGNRRLFGDRLYTVRRKGGKLYLERLTTAWTDMFGQEKRLHFRLNVIDPKTLKIGSLVDGEFKDKDAVAAWMLEHGATYGD